jgi:hypothetical protein
MRGRRGVERRGTGRRGTVRSAVVLGLAAMVLLAGCGGIPTAGGVITGDVMDEGQASVGYLPSGPQVDATAKQIIEGFIRAGTSPADDFSIARQFLAGDAQSAWAPNKITQVRAGIGSVSEISDGLYTYSVSTTAFVDAEGHYSDESASQNLEFRLVKNDDKQWRIVEAPDGIVLSADSFSTIFEEHAIYFFDPTYRYLVPDVRWFPKTTLLPTRVVSALLAGQSPYLRQGVTITEFPTGTALGSRVVLDSGVASVDLSEEAQAASVEQRQRMRQQLLASIGGVSAVTVTVNGVALAIPEATDVATINPTVVSQLLVRAGDSFGFLQSDGTIISVRGQSSEIVALNADAASYAYDGSMSAVRAADGVHLVFKGNAEAILVDARPRLAAPSVDASFFVWSVPTASPRAMRVFDKKGVAYPIDASVLPKGRVVTFALSRDGSRLLMLMKTSVGPRLLVAGVRRSDGVPVALAEPVYLNFDQSTTPLDAAWVDDRTVTTIARSDEAGFSFITLFGIGGRRTPAGRVTDGESIAVIGGNTGRDGLRVTDSAGSVYLLRGNTWADTNTVVSFVATQQ